MRNNWGSNSNFPLAGILRGPASWFRTGVAMQSSNQSSRPAHSHHDSGVTTTTFIRRLMRCGLWETATSLHKYSRSVENCVISNRQLSPAVLISCRNIDGTENAVMREFCPTQVWLRPIVAPFPEVQRVVCCVVCIASGRCRIKQSLDVFL